MQTSDLPDVEIRPDTAFRMLDARELWSYRELMYFLTWRDVKVRYKQTAIGILWAVVQPVAMMLVFTLIFGRLARMPSSGIPFSLFSLSGLLPWQLFSRANTESTNSLVTDQRLISRVYFPRIIVPIASVMAALVTPAFEAHVSKALNHLEQAPGPCHTCGGRSSMMTASSAHGAISVLKLRRPKASAQR